ncbi:unnamed protein product, partial [Rangifer tarandus platyrhynchus]
AVLCQKDESGKHSEEATARPRKQSWERSSVVWSSTGTADFEQTLGTCTSEESRKVRNRVVHRMKEATIHEQLWAALRSLILDAKAAAGTSSAANGMAEAAEVTAQSAISTRECRVRAPPGPGLPRVLAKSCGTLSPRCAEVRSAHTQSDLPGEAVEREIGNETHDMQIGFNHLEQMVQKVADRRKPVMGGKDGLKTLTECCLHKGKTIWTQLEVWPSAQELLQNPLLFTEEAFRPSQAPSTCRTGSTRTGKGWVSRPFTPHASGHAPQGRCEPRAEPREGRRRGVRTADSALEAAQVRRPRVCEGLTCLPLPKTEKVERRQVERQEGAVLWKLCSSQRLTRLQNLRECGQDTHFNCSHVLLLFNSCKHSLKPAFRAACCSAHQGFLQKLAEPRNSQTP